MNDQMRHHVIAQALAATETEEDLKVVAKNISNEMDRKYGKSWICSIGINTTFSGISIESKENSFIHFSFEEKHFVVFKLPLETSVVNEVNRGFLKIRRNLIFSRFIKVKFSEVVKKYKNLEPNITHDGGFTKEIKLATFNISLSSLDQNFENCENVSESSKQCYRLIKGYIHGGLKSKFGGLWSVSVGEKLKFDSVNDKYSSYIEFFIGDIGFDVEKLVP
jgi:hypothetical protein